MDLITYEFYKDDFGGSSIPETAFKRYIRYGMMVVRQHTFDRVIEEWLDEAKMAACEIAEILFSQEDSRLISSVSNGGYSVSYKADDMVSLQISDIMSRYLGHTDLLYWGCDDE